METKKIKLEETTILNGYKNALCNDKIMPPSESHCSTTFRTCIYAAITFLKFAKHEAKHTVLRFDDIDGTFIMAFETSLESDDDGNKSWTVGAVFDENDLEITSDTKVYRNNDAMYLTSYKETIKFFLDENSKDTEIAPDLLYYTCTYPLKAIKLFASEAFDNNTATVIDVDIQNVAIITYTKDDNDKVNISLSLHQNIKQMIKSDGNSDMINDANQILIA